MGKRKISLDILRIYSTFQVVSFHCYVYPLSNKCFDLPFLSELLFSLTRSCNIHFILISSYITSTSKYNFSKQLPIIIETVFYSLFLYFISIHFFKFKTYNYDTFIYYLFPIANTVYWYTGPFLLSGLICSLIYPTIKSQTKKIHFLVMSIIFFLYSIQFVGYYTKLGLYTHTYSSFLVISIIGSFIHHFLLFL